jgi:hypothetical protein
MAFASAPAALGPDAIGMSAVTATDAVSGVQYIFRCTAGGPGCVSSGWQTSTSYTANGLAADTQYTFTVTARDLSGATERAWSATTDEPAIRELHLGQRLAGGRDGKRRAHRHAQRQRRGAGHHRACVRRQAAKPVRLPRTSLELLDRLRRHCRGVCAGLEVRLQFGRNVQPNIP